MRIEIYNPLFKSEWDNFVRDSKNGTFLFYRNYMDYHCDRFIDNSLLIFDDKNNLLALLPANRKNSELCSHGGLTYGGFITDERMKTSLMLEIFQETISLLKKNEFTLFTYKTIPRIYHKFPAEEDLYALFRSESILQQRNVSSTIQLSKKINYQERRKRAIKKASKSSIDCRITNDYSAYWHILEQNLSTVHGKAPVHTLAEIERLQSSFPNNIKLYAGFAGDEMVAGTLVYETEYVAHAQYIAASINGRNIGALDLLFHFLLTDIYSDKHFFDFGISTEKGGTFLNSGLSDFKEGFGGRAIVYDTYGININ